MVDMGLKDTLLASGQTVAEVAAKAKTPPAHLYNILNGKRRPRLKLAKRLQVASKGVLRAAVLMGLEDQEPSPLGRAS